MKKLMFLLISFLIVGAVALQSSVPNNNLVNENAQVILAPNCDDVIWTDHCIETWDNVKCSVSVSGGTCSFTYMKKKSFDLPPTPPPN